jgi:hypothetical protein
MKGRQKGRPTKWVDASIEQWVNVNRTGVKFAIWDKWKRNRKKVGELTVSVGGLRWVPASGKKERRLTWEELPDCFAGKG